MSIATNPIAHKPAIAVALAGSLAVAVWASTAQGVTAGAGAISAGTVTRGGLVAGSKVLRVTSLADSGPGTLRAAVAVPGPRVVVFDVAGTIQLEHDLRLDRPFLTVAGQTAPAPGILIRGAKVRISSHDVVVQHISVRPGRLDPVPNNADGVSIGPCADCDTKAQDILLENVSVAWATDENVGLWGDALSRVTVRASLIAEGLRNAGHPKGTHSMGLLIGAGVQAVEVVGNLFVSNMYRSPVVGSQATAFVANNYIVNPGRAAMHLYSGPDIGASFIGNVVQSGTDSDERLTALQWKGDIHGDYPGARLIVQDNHCCTGEASEDNDQAKTAQAPFVSELPVTSASWTVLPATAVRDWVVRHAGARPAERNPADVRVVAAVEDGSSRIIDDPAEVGGHPHGPIVEEQADLPARPFAPTGLKDMTRIEAWLCLRHLEVGGAPNERCRADAAVLRQALVATN
jgi:hypothetical protein